MKIIGVWDAFGESGEYEELLEKFGLTTGNIATSAREVLRREKMKIFIDTANIDEIKKVNDWGVIDGVTTNPTLVAKEHRGFNEVVREIISIIDGPISLEIISLQSDEMIKEAIEMSGWSKNVVIKIPMTPEGLKAVKILNAKNIKTNVTLVFSVNQAILAAKSRGNLCEPVYWTAG